MIRYIFTLLLLLIASISFATPNTTSVTGDVSHGETIIIQGTGFGTKSPAAPLKYDNFESGTVGNNLGNGWYTFSYQNLRLPRYSTDQIRTGGTQSVEQDFEYQNNSSCYIGLSDMNENFLYVHGYYYWTTDLSLYQFRGVKFYNLGSDRSGTSSTDWQTRFESNTDGWQNMYSYTNACSGSANFERVTVSNFYTNDSSWHRFEGQISVVDGNEWRDIWRDLTRRGLLEAVLDWTGSGCNIDYINLGHYTDADGTDNGETHRYWDEIYVDDTPARVEIGNAATWAGCTHREIQIPSTWSATSIGLTVNTGTFNTNDTAYIYVVEDHNDPDITGYVDPTGYEITIGDTATDTAGPSVVGYGPADEAINEPIDTDISIRLDDPSGVDVDTISLTIEGTEHNCSQAVDPSGVSDLTCTGDVTSITVLKSDNSFSNSTEINVSADADDLLANSMTQEVWSFTTTSGEADTIDPVITITSPTSDTFYLTNDSAITISGTASDNVELFKVAWANSQGGSGDCSGTATWSTDVLPIVGSSFGSDLVTNGDFASDYSDWSENNCTATQGTNGGVANSVSIADDGAWSELYQSITVEDGEYYVITADVYSVGTDVSENGSILVDMGARTNTWGDYQIDGSGIDGQWETINGIVLASGVTMTIRLHSEETDTAYFDDVSVKKITSFNVLTITATDSSANTGTDVINIAYDAPAASSPSRVVVYDASGKVYEFSADGISLVGE